MVVNDIPLPDEVPTVSYGLRFLLLIYGPSAKRTGHKSTGKNEDP